MKWAWPGVGVGGAGWAGPLVAMEERRSVQLPRESVRLVAESTGLELSDEVAALLAEDVCYRLREATQVRPAGRGGLGPAHSAADGAGSVCPSPPRTAPSS